MARSQSGATPGQVLGQAPSFGAAFEPSQRYPDPSVRILDPAFGRYRIFSSSVERLATGLRP